MLSSVRLSTPAGVPRTLQCGLAGSDSRTYTSSAACTLSLPFLFVPRTKQCPLEYARRCARTLQCGLAGSVSEAHIHVGTTRSMSIQRMQVRGCTLRIVRGSA